MTENVPVAVRLGVLEAVVSRAEVELLAVDGRDECSRLTHVSPVRDVATREVAPEGRLQAVTGMCTHAVDVTDADEVNDDIAGWLRAAYEQAG